MITSLLNLLHSISTSLCSFNNLFVLPSSILFFSVAVILTIKTGFLQFRAFPLFLKIIGKGITGKSAPNAADTINPFHAMFTAMATTIGMGNVVVPAIAIYTGGPGALFWLLLYIFFASVTKLTEVCFAIQTRVTLPDGKIVGGPMEYLKKVTPFLAYWYAGVMVLLFIEWTAVQSNTLANIYVHENIPKWITGFILAIIVWVVLNGGAKRVGNIASKLVPIMFVLYVGFSLYILFSDTGLLRAAIGLVFANAFSTKGALGGVFTISIFQAMKAGVFNAIFITEAGIGTSSIPHAVANVKRPIDQGVLALFSMVSDAFLVTMSGLLVLVTGVWTYGDFRSTLIYEAFEKQAPMGGQYILLISITLFVLTTAIGNSFNGSQTFASLTKDKWVKGYMGLTALAIFFGALVPLKSIWPLVDCLIALVAVPNVLGILYLAFKYPKVLKLPKNN